MKNKMNKKEEVIYILNNLGYQINNDLIIFYNNREIPMQHMIEPFLEKGQFNHLNFNANHICNEVVIKSLQMLDHSIHE